MTTSFWNKLDRPILALAPMVGVSDSAFRQLSKKWGADVVYSEMISADALIRGAEKAYAMLDHTEDEYPFVVQLMGRDPSVLAAGTKIAEAHGASGVDLNFGCPAQKIARNECGAVLMRDPDLCRELIQATMQSTTLPVSIKVRVSIKAGPNQYDDGKAKRITILDFLKKVDDLPIAAIMVHGRSFEDPFDGGVQSDVIRAVKRVFTGGPVLANGGLTSIESAKDFLEETSADGIGFGRTAIGHPWVFRQTAEYLSTGTYNDVSWSDIKSTIMDHAQLFEAHRARRPFKEIRRHLTHYVRGRAQASEIRQRLVHVNSVSEVSSVLDAY